MSDFKVEDSAIHISQKVTVKKSAKDLLRNKYGLTINKKRLLLSVFIDDKQSDQETITFLNSFLEAVKSVSVSVIVVVPKSIKIDLEQFKSPRGVFVLPLAANARKRVLEASDVSFIFPLSKMKIKDLHTMWSHGVVPISAKNKGIEDYNPNHETGNSFMVRQENVWSLFAALVRATETYRFPYDWKHIMSQALASS